jgi:hypothetical protein
MFAPPTGRPIIVFEFVLKHQSGNAKDGLEPFLVDQDASVSDIQADILSLEEVHE